MSEVWIPDNPPERQYTCPWCKKGVHCFRIGESSSYWVMDASDPNKEHKCNPPPPKKGFAIPRELLGYKPPKVKKDAQPGPETGSAGSNPTGAGIHELDRGSGAEGSVSGDTSPAKQA